MWVFRDNAACVDACDISACHHQCSQNWALEMVIDFLDSDDTNLDLSMRERTSLAKTKNIQNTKRLDINSLTYKIFITLRLLLSY